MAASDDRGIAHHVWEARYRLGEGETGIEDTWWRVADAVARAEPQRRVWWCERFRALMDDGGFLPAGRILAGAGSGARVTLANCFVMGRIAPSEEGLAAALMESALTLSQGGGIGCDFSSLPPRDSRGGRGSAPADGPVAALQRWQAMCERTSSSGSRRGAMMATLRCDHPDIEDFIAAKATPGRLPHFNLSVLVSDALLHAVREDAPWPLVFPETADHGGEFVHRAWSGDERPVSCRIHRRIPARRLWRSLAWHAHASGDPGLLFIDRINRENNLGWRERIDATNPCGEIPLPPYGACVLGSINLPRFVRAPFSPDARLDLPAIAETATLAVRFLDDVIDISGFPLPAQSAQAQGARRIGLGVTGLADALAMLGLPYDTPQARVLAADLLKMLRDSAYRASVALAREKGAFPFFQADPYLAAPFVRRLPTDLREAIAHHGIRNSHLLAIAPAGSISLLAGNVSSGIEPIFAGRQLRRIRHAGGERRVALEDFALAQWHARHPQATEPPAFVTAQSLSPRAHLAMQAVLQPWVDNAIAKTVNLPESASVEAVIELFDEAAGTPVKGVTVFRQRTPEDAVIAADAIDGHACRPGAPRDGCMA